MISVEAALARLANNPLPQRVEQVALAQALHRTLAGPVFARLDQPSAPVSAMDGYAVRFADLKDGLTRFRVTGESAAGAPFPGRVDRQEAVRIFTGAHLPDGADHVVIQEQTQQTGNHVDVRGVASAPENVRPKGLDFSAGHLLLEAGCRIGPAELALIAAGNVDTVAVVRRARVGLLANGNELRPVGSDLGPGDSVNSNALSLSALFQTWGADPVDLGIAGDSVDSILSHIEGRSDIDLFVPIGGASVGEYDFMHEAFRQAGFENVFRKIAVRPGKPTWFSVSPEQKVLGLPGNPASAMVCAYLFVAPLLGLDWRRALLPAHLRVSLSPNGPRESFLRARARVSQTGQIVVETIAEQDSSLIRPFVEMNCLLHRTVDAPAAVPGDGVSILMLGRSLTV